MKQVLVVLGLLVALLAACGGNNGGASSGDNGGSADGDARLANPASVNCADQGGTLQIESRPDGAQFGVCYFEDNRQCEEWALLRGACPEGGVKVTGYVTEAGRFCAISGGSYVSTATAAEGEEVGVCTLPDGTACDAQAYYEGACGAAEP